MGKSTLIKLCHYKMKFSTNNHTDNTGDVLCSLPAWFTGNTSSYSEETRRADGWIKSECAWVVQIQEYIFRVHYWLFRLSLKESALPFIGKIMQGWSSFIMRVSTARTVYWKKHRSNGQMSSFGKPQNQCVIHSPHFPFQNKAPIRKKGKRKTLMKWTGQCNKPETNIF